MGKSIKEGNLGNNHNFQCNSIKVKYSMKPICLESKLIHLKVIYGINKDIQSKLEVNHKQNTKKIKIGFNPTRNGNFSRNYIFHIENM